MRLYIFFILAALSSLTGCSDSQDTPKEKVYFDLSGFFKSEAARLTKSNPLIEKTVSQNQASEMKQVKIPDWKNEFILFIESDINKPAWKRSYTVSQVGDELVYTANEDDLRTRKISIRKTASGKISHIYIKNQTFNYLYTSGEELEYYPDSLFVITKNQQVRILGSNNYIIRGNFKKL